MADHYDRVARVYDLRYDTSSGKIYHRHICRHMLDWLPRGKLLLDLGCGTGLFMRRYGELGGAAIGLDISRGMVEAAREQGRWFEYLVGTAEVLERLGLERGKYFLYVSRMEPENNALLVREAFERVETDLRLALVGDAPYARAYIERVRETRDARIVIPGAIYGQGYHELTSHCFAYIHATEVGGTHPALIEAMGRGALALYLNTTENAEVAGGAGIPFERDNLTAQIRYALDLTDEEREQWRARAVERVRRSYSWDAVTDAYEALLIGLIGRR